MEFLISIATITVLYWLINTWERKAIRDKSKRVRPNGSYPSATIRTIKEPGLDEMETKISE